MNLLRLFTETEAKLSLVKLKLDNPYCTEDATTLKDEKEYLLDIIALLFKELER